MSAAGPRQRGSAPSEKPGRLPAAKRPSDSNSTIGVVERRGARRALCLQRGPRRVRDSVEILRMGPTTCACCSPVGSTTLRDREQVGEHQETVGRRDPKQRVQRNAPGAMRACGWKHRLMRIMRPASTDKTRCSAKEVTHRCVDPKGVVGEVKNPQDPVRIGPHWVLKHPRLPWCARSQVDRSWVAGSCAKPRVRRSTTDLTHTNYNRGRARRRQYRIISWTTLERPNRRATVR